jgi:hypothetical protein
MVGEHVMTQKDIQSEARKPDVIGMGSYNSDSHNIRRIVNDEGFVENEGDMQSVAFSASHVAYSTLRMEPQYMIIGQAAGVAATMALATGKPVQEIDSAALTTKLRGQGAVMEWTARKSEQPMPGRR